MSYENNNTSIENQLLQSYLTQYEIINREILELTQISREILNDIRYIYRNNLNINATTNRNRSRNRSRNFYSSNGNSNSNTNNDYFNIFDLHIPSLNTRLNNNFRNTTSSQPPLPDFFNDVIVRPTEEQVQNATSLVSFDTIENPLNETCPITLERFNHDSNVRQINSCQHLFNNEAILFWFESNVRCPVCRLDIRVQSSSSGVNNNNNTNNSEEYIRNRRRPTTNNSNVNENSNIDSSINLFAQTLLNALDTTSPSNIDRDFYYDLSNNMLYFETYLRPNRRD